jgi:peroxiredoxin
VPENSINSRPASRKISRRSAILFFGLGLTLAALPFRDWIRSRVLEWGTLANNSPTVDLVEEMIETSRHPHAAIQAAWDTGKIVHRRAAIGAIHRLLLATRQLPPTFESLTLSAAFDPDLSVRELAFRILRDARHSALAALAAAQLHDCDPEVRLLGLEFLRRAGNSNGLATLLPLLDDTDPLVAISSLKLFEKWTRQNFGVKASEITPAVEAEISGLREPHQGSRARLKAGADRARTWWAEHRSEFVAAPFEVPLAPALATRPMRVQDFELPTLDGRTFRLSDFRGKIVLLTFWTTWYPPCLSGMNDFITLQKSGSNHLCIVGVSLDNVPDVHGHRGGHEEAHHHEDHDQDHGRHHEDVSVNEIRQKVARTVSENDLNYPVLFDEDFRVGGRFNGGDLPTTVIIDADGVLRRRFSGRRPLPVLQAMVAEATLPKVGAPNPFRSQPTKRKQ